MNMNENKQLHKKVYATKENNEDETSLTVFGGLFTDDSYYNANDHKRTTTIVYILY